MEQYNILCVDDEKMVLSALKRGLELNPAYHVYLAEGARQALDLAEQREFNAYLVDQHMPQIDGVTFVSMLKKIDKNPLVFFLTGQDLDGKAYQASLEDSEFGGAYYFTKPWNESLYIGLSQALKSRKESNALRKENQRLNLWVKSFLEEASISQVLKEQPSLDGVLDHLYHRLLERELVEEVDLFMYLDGKLELMRSTIRENKLPRNQIDFAKKAIEEGTLVQKLEQGWRYHASLGIKEHKIGLVRLKLTQMNDCNLQFIDYIIHQGGSMLQLVLAQIQLQKAMQHLHEAQDELIVTEKSNYLSEISRWLMHNINNILCGIKGDNDLAQIAWQSYLSDSNEAKREGLISQIAKSLPSMESGIQRLTYLIDDFRLIANSNKTKAKRYELNNLIHTTIRNFIGLKKIDPALMEITEQYDPELRFVMVNRELLIRMTEELMTMMVMRATLTEITTKKLQNYAEVTISNNQMQLLIKEQQWLEEPNFSNKIPLEMSGMELMIVKEAVLFHHGEIKLINTKGEGSSIRVRLPLEGVSQLAKNTIENPPETSIRERML